MTVYVDTQMNQYGRMKMCHMIADTTSELLSMADQIGIDQRHIQFPGQPKEHFDICLRAKVDAIRHGAIEVSDRDLVRIVQRRRKISVELPLTDALANRIICACADDIILASKQVAEELTADVLEGTLAIPDIKENQQRKTP